MGEVFLHVVSSDGGALGLDACAYSGELSLIQIPSDIPLRWAGVPILGGDAVNGIADHLMLNLLNLPQP